MSWSLKTWYPATVRWYGVPRFRYPTLSSPEQHVVFSVRLFSRTELYAAISVGIAVGGRKVDVEGAWGGGVRDLAIAVRKRPTSSAGSRKEGLREHLRSAYVVLDQSRTIHEAHRGSRGSRWCRRAIL